MIEAVRQFADPVAAHDFWAFQMRWQGGVACPLDCGSTRVAYMPKRRRWYCNDCKGQFTAKTRTIFEDSPIGFDKWLPAFWLLASNRNGISSYELGRALHVTQRTAWFMLHRLRAAMKDPSFEQFTGVVEADETYIGGKLENLPLRKRRNIPAKKWNESKTAVFGIAERKGRVRAWAVANVTQKTLLPKLRDSVSPDATLYTDSSVLYTHVNEYFLTRSAVNHSIKEYVRGNVHTNNIEAFWAVLKRTIGGTYTHVHPKHLDRYLAEQVFRLDSRREADGDRFVKAVRRAEGRRLTYKSLIAK